MVTHNRSIKRSILAAVAISAICAVIPANAQVSPTGVASYTGGFFTEDFETGAPALPTGFFGLVGGLGATTDGTVVSIPSAPAGTASDFYYFTLGGDNAFGSYNELAPNATRYLSLEIQNNSGTTTPLTNVQFTLENFGTGTEEVRLLAFISPTPFASAADMNAALGGNFETVGTFNPAPGSSTSESVTFGSVNGLLWTPGDYLYLAFSNPNGGLAAPAIDNFSLAAVPEPSTCIAAGLLLGTVGLARVRRRKGAELPVALA